MQVERVLCPQKCNGKKTSKRNCTAVQKMQQKPAESVTFNVSYAQMVSILRNNQMGL